jgi:transposase-like protein
MEKCLEQIKPQVSETWRADELFVKIRGNMKYLFAMMDDETGFWIAQEVADSKHVYDARRLFQKAREAIGRKPKTLITDGVAAYHEAWRKEFYTMKSETCTEHIRNISIKGERNNNKMERLNGEIRDREEIMRGLKKPETPIIPGYQIYHNYVRPHEALDGKTPAEACRIQVQGENKWLTLIQNASHHSLVKSPNRHPRT